MPDYSPVEEIDQSQPLDMSNVKYSSGTIFSAAASNAYHGFNTRRIVNTLGNAKPNKDIPASMPADQAFVDDLKKDRPGFNPPIGLPKFVTLALAEQWNNDEYFKKVSSRPASLMGKVGAIGGEFIGGFTDPKQFIYAASGAGIAEELVAPIAESFLTRLAANKIIGSGVAKVGTAISNSAISGAGMGFTGELSAQSDEFTENEILGKPHDYIEALQNLGSATLYGAIAGIGFHAAGRTLGIGRDALIGKRVEISPEIPADVEAGKEAIPAQYERQGGLLNRLNIPDRVKSVIANAYKPWTKAADDVTKTEAVGQMANGNLVDIEPVIKQGMHDQGVEFRDALAKEGIDPVEVDEALSVEQERLVSEMFARHFAGQQKITAREYYRGRSDYTFGFKSLEEAGTSEAELRKADHELGKGYWYADTEEHAKAYGNVVEKVTGNFKILDLDGKDNPELIKMYRDIHNKARDLTKYEDTQKKIKEFRQAVKDAGYQGVRRFGVVSKDTGRYETMFFDKPKSIDQLAEMARNQEVADLQDQFTAAQTIRDHINDAHKPLTQGEMEAYAEHLKESNMPDNGYDISAGENHTIDEQLAQHSDKDIEILAESTKDSETGGKEIAESAEKLKNQKVYEDMAQNMTDCILKGGL